MKKIMFDDHFGLMNAVMEGRKTMTRRTITGITPEDSEYLETAFDWDFRESVIIDQYARYKPGEVVAVAQSYSAILDELETPGNFVCMEHWEAASGKRAHYADLIRHHGFGNKMFVSADEMPHQIRITSVRIERLQDISNEDCMREGVRKLESKNCPTMFTFDGWRFKNKVNRCTDSPKEVFEALFKKLSGKKAWDDNPWVFVYEFELVK